MSNDYFCTTNKKMITSFGKPLLEGKADVLGRYAYYKLFSVRHDGERYYRIFIGYDGTAAECLVRCKREFVGKLFFSLLCGRVTPCSMIYIVREMMEDPEDIVLFAQ